MPTYVFGIDKTIRCYVRIPSTSQLEARQSLARLLATSPMHLDDPDAGITYTDRADDAPLFADESLALVDVEGGEDEVDLSPCETHTTFQLDCAACIAGIAA